MDWGILYVMEYGRQFGESISWPEAMKKVSKLKFEKLDDESFSRDAEVDSLLALTLMICAIIDIITA